MTIELARFPLAHLPTPVEPLPQLTRHFGGPQLYIKRDDMTGLAAGGNKTRKLEFLVAEALAMKADTLITVGSAQSNHCRQTAAAAVKAGMRCILVLRGKAPSECTGNLLLDWLLGAEVCWAGDRSREDVMEEAAAAERAAGRNPYPIPLGGSTPLGASAYHFAIGELMEQTSEKFDRIVFASSSAGTQAGLVAGAWLNGFSGQVLGISIDEELDPLREEVAEIATGTASLLGRPHRFQPSDIHANADYLGEGYGIVGEPEREAILLFARHEGILLDPVYTGRAAAGMIDLIRKGAFSREEKILFWHTGGTPALWAYIADLMHGSS